MEGPEKNDKAVGSKPIHQMLAHGCVDQVERCSLAKKFIERQASTPRAAVFILEKLFGGAELERIAEDPTTDGATLITLAFSPSSAVRQAVADNCNTPLAILLMLAHDADADVRYRLAENYHVSKLVLKVLADDENPYVQYRARRTISRLSPRPVCFFCAA